jgi:hypothetical protein
VQHFQELEQGLGTLEFRNVAGLVENGVQNCSFSREKKVLLLHDETLRPTRYVGLGFRSVSVASLRGCGCNVVFHLHSAERNAAVLQQEMSQIHTYVPGAVQETRYRKKCYLEFTTAPCDPAAWQPAEVLGPFPTHVTLPLSFMRFYPEHGTWRKFERNMYKTFNILDADAIELLVHTKAICESFAALYAIAGADSQPVVSASLRFHISVAPGSRAESASASAGASAGAGIDARRTQVPSNMSFRIVMRNLPHVTSGHALKLHRWLAKRATNVSMSVELEHASCVLMWKSVPRGCTRETQTQTQTTQPASRPQTQDSRPMGEEFGAWVE